VGGEWGETLSTEWAALLIAAISLVLSSFALLLHWRYPYRARKLTAVQNLREAYGETKRVYDSFIRWEALGKNTDFLIAQFNEFRNNTIPKLQERLDQCGVLASVPVEVWGEKLEDIAQFCVKGEVTIVSYRDSLCEKCEALFTHMDRELR
jgi:hypothetical protein